MATIWHHLQGQPEGQLEDGQRGAEPLPAEAERGPQEAARHHGPQDQVKKKVLRASCCRNQKVVHEAPTQINDLRGLSWCI